MHPIKKFIRTLANLPVSISFRNALGVYPKYYREPDLNYSVSDLFFWRSDEVWRTRFDLLNLPSVLYPENNISDKVTLIFYDRQGQEFFREQAIIPPLQTKTILVEDILGDNVGFGSMAFFHNALEKTKPNQPQTCTVERGFAAYQRITDDSPLWSYIHGAAYVLAKPPDHDEVQTTRRTLVKKILYRPQLTLSDCDRFDLIYINPSDSNLEIKVRAYDQSAQLILEKSGVLPPRGVKCFSIDNKDRKTYRVENESRAYMWRPFILKYYDTHFDIFHS